MQSAPRRGAATLLEFDCCRTPAQNTIAAMKLTSPHVAASILLALTLGCVSVPGSSPSYQVAEVTRIGPFIQARLDWTSDLAAVSSDARITLLFPSGAVCDRLLAVGTETEYLARGMTGTVRVGEETCESVGIASLREWRDRRPRPRSGAPLPRAQATYRIVLRAGDTAILRGRFPLASLIGWAGGEDTLVLMPTTGKCTSLLDRTVASMEYRPGGRIAVALVSSDGLCALQGFARPEAQLGL